MTLLSTPTPNLWSISALRPYLGSISSRADHCGSLSMFRGELYNGISRMFISPVIEVNFDSIEQDVMTALGKFPRLNLIGGHGTGKSIICNWLGWRLSSGLTQPLPNTLNDRMPILIRCAEEDLLGSTGLLDHVLRHARNRENTPVPEHCSLAITKQISTGSFVLIVDQFDEISSVAQRVVVGFLKESILAGAAIVIGSESPIPGINGLNDGHLRGFEFNQRIQAVKQWRNNYDEVGISTRHNTGYSNMPVDQTLLATCPANFRMMFEVNQHGGGLPTTQAELIEQFVTMSLTKLCVKTSQGFGRLSIREHVRLWSEIAYDLWHAFDGQNRYITHDEFSERLTDILLRNGHPESQVQDIAMINLSYASTSCGLLENSIRGMRFSEHLILTGLASMHIAERMVSPGFVLDHSDAVLRPGYVRAMLEGDSFAERMVEDALAMVEANYHPDWIKTIRRLIA